MPQAKTKKGRTTAKSREIKEERFNPDSLPVHLRQQPQAMPQGIDQPPSEYIIQGMQERLALANANAAWWQGMAQYREAQLRSLYGEYEKLKVELEKLIGESDGDEDEDDDEESSGAAVPRKQNGSGSREGRAHSGKSSKAKSRRA